MAIPFPKHETQDIPLGHYPTELHYDAVDTLFKTVYKYFDEPPRYKPIKFRHMFIYKPFEPTPPNCNVYIL